MSSQSLGFLLAITRDWHPLGPSRILLFTVRCRTRRRKLSRKFKKQVLSRRDQGWCDQVLPSGMQQLLQEQDVGETLESARWNVSTIMEERGGFSMLRKLGECHIDGMPQFKSTIMGVQEQRDEFMIFCNEFSCGLKSWYQKHRVGLGNLANKNLHRFEATRLNKRVGECCRQGWMTNVRGQMFLGGGACSHLHFFAQPASSLCNANTRLSFSSHCGVPTLLQDYDSGGMLTTMRGIRHVR